MSSIIASKNQQAKSSIQTEEEKDLKILISRENDKVIGQAEMDKYLDKKFGKSQFSK